MASSQQLLSVIDGAARQVEVQILRDNSFPDLRELLGHQSHVSGDYAQTSKPVLQKGAVIPLPSELSKLYSQSMIILFLFIIENHTPFIYTTKELEYKTFMGVFPEIDRVWMTIDNDLYLWSYVDG